MKKKSPFYKTGISRSPFNAHEPGHEELPKYHIKELQKDKKLEDPTMRAFRESVSGSGYTVKDQIINRHFKAEKSKVKGGIINTPIPETLSQGEVGAARAFNKAFSGRERTRLDIHREKPKPKGILTKDIKITAPTEIKPLQYKREGALRTSKYVSLSSTKKS